MGLDYKFAAILMTIYVSTLDWYIGDFIVSILANALLGACN